jgi:hypothetical protein
MENLFKSLGYDYRIIPQESSIDVSHKNIKIKSYDHLSNTIVWHKINKLIRKTDSYIVNIYFSNDELALRTTAAHRIFDPVVNDYIAVGKASSLYALDDKGNVISVYIVKTSEISPILDLEIEGVSNYFSNHLLSHNSGGNSLKFYASQRIQLKRKEILGEKEKFGIEVIAKVVKNKVAPPFRECSFNIIFDKGIDWAEDLRLIGMKEGLIEKNGGWFKLNGDTIQGIEPTNEYIRTHPDFVKLVKDAAIGIKVVEEFEPTSEEANEEE